MNGKLVNSEIYRNWKMYISSGYGVRLGQFSKCQGPVTTPFINYQQLQTIAAADSVTPRHKFAGGMTKINFIFLPII